MCNKLMFLFIYMQE